MSSNKQAKFQWLQILTKSIDEILEDVEYHDSDPREKLLSFYYTHFEHLNEEREFVRSRFKQSSCARLVVYELSDYRKIFVEHVSKIVSEAIDFDLLYNLSIVNKGYSSIIWGQLLFLIRYWLTDESLEFEKTDELIERSVTSLFDLVGKGNYQSTLDFGKFLIQNPIKIQRFI